MIILVSSVPIDLLKNHELEAEESPNPPHVYGPVRRYEPTMRRPLNPRPLIGYKLEEIIGESPNPSSVYRYEPIARSYTTPKESGQADGDTQEPPIRTPRRYEPTPIAPAKRTKKHLYLVADQQKEEV